MGMVTNDMFVVYDEDGAIVDTRKTKNPYSVDLHRTERAARAALTRFINREQKAGKNTNYDMFNITDIVDYEENHEAWVELKCIMTGKVGLYSINTPFTSTPASETYWSS